MGEDYDYSEERYIGNRRFRKMDDGRIVEVLGDGSVRDNIIVGGELIPPYGADFDKLTEKIEGPESIKEKPKAKNVDEIVNRVIDSWGLKSSLGSGGQIGGGGELSEGSGLSKGGDLVGNVDDPLKKFSEKKTESFRDHMSKVQDEFKKQRGQGKTSSKSKSLNTMQSMKRKPIFKK
jgi:hypothetical protein